MPRSKVKPTVSTYHEAVNLIISTISPKICASLPLTKKGDKFTSKGLVYLSGMFDLPIDAKIQDIYATIVDIYSIPSDYLTWVRVMQQTIAGVPTPKPHGDIHEVTSKVFEVLANLEPQSFNSSTSEYEPDRDPDVESSHESEAITDQTSTVADESVTNPKPDWDTLAAANPLAAQFVKSLIATPDDDNCDDDFVPYGSWGYDEDYEFDYEFEDTDDNNDYEE